MTDRKARARWRPLRGVAALALMASSSGCSNAARVYVQLQTDLAPGIEFDEVVVNGPATQRVVVSPTRAYARPTQVAEFGGITGRFQAELSLRRAGREVLRRRVARPIAGDTVVSVVVARQCLDFACPPPGEPEATECLGAQCVPPECDSLEDCGTPQCTRDADCTASVACARGVCVAGACLELPEGTACPSMESCVPGVGCVPTSGPIDAGPPDGGSPDAGPPADAFVAPPPFELHFLPRGAAAWSELTVAGEAPREPIEAVFARPGRDELIFVTATDLHVLRLTDHRFVERLSRDVVFPELAGVDIGEASTNGTQVFFHTRETYRYAWDGASTTTARLDAMAANDWSAPLAPSDNDIEAIFHMPDNSEGWSVADVSAACGRARVGAYDAFLTFNGIGPGLPTVAIYDIPCGAFVERVQVDTFPPFALSGAPGIGAILAAEWVDGLYAITRRTG